MSAVVPRSRGRRWTAGTAILRPERNFPHETPAYAKASSFAEAPADKSAGKHERHEKGRLTAKEREWVAGIWNSERETRNAELGTVGPRNTRKAQKGEREVDREARRNAKRAQQDCAPTTEDSAMDCPDGFEWSHRYL